MLFGVAPRTSTKKTCVLKKLDYMLLFRLNRDLRVHFDDHKNLHLDHEQDIRMSSRNYEESGYGLALDLVTILN